MTGIRFWWSTRIPFARGLHSHNPEYRMMRFGEDSEVRCVGRVLGRLEEQQMLTPEEIEELEANHELSD